MKTRNTNNFYILTTLLSFVLLSTSCKKDEFFEKEYIETIKDKYDRLNDQDPNEHSNVNDDDQDEDGSNDNSDSGSDTDSGSNPDDQDNTDDENPTLNSKVDYFTQNQTLKKLDILWVVDNSGSMHDEQKALGDNFNQFISDFAQKDIDFQMAITTTDTSHSYAGHARPSSIELLNTNKLKEDKNQFIQDFKNLIMVGTHGSGYEKGILASEKFTQRYHNSFLREDAFFIIVYVSDEEDQSPQSVAKHLESISSHKQNKGFVKAYSIVNMVKTPSNSNGLIYDYKRYKEISDSTNGKVAHIKDDFSKTLKEMGTQIADLSNSFPLSQLPYNNHITIKVNNQVVTDWSYDSTSNTITFADNAIPSNGSAIEVHYSTED